MTTAIEQNETISLLDEVKLQARVLLPLIRALRKELGERPANRMVAAALRNWSRSVIQNSAAKIQGSPRQKWKSLTTASLPRIGQDITLEWIRHDSQEIRFNVIECRYADFFRGLGEPQLGTILVCESDIHIAELGAPQIQFTRTQTLMNGAIHCDFHYRLQANQV
jgi:hypothetical protein